MIVGGNYLNKKKHPFASSCKDLEGREGDELGELGHTMTTKTKNCPDSRGQIYFKCQLFFVVAVVVFLNSSLLQPHLDLLQNKNIT